MNRWTSAAAALRELLLVATLFGVYEFGRLAVGGDVRSAYANAARVWAWERAWRLPDEAALQQAILDQGWLVRAANLYYAGVHFPATVAFLLWAYARRRALYRCARTVLAALTGAALAVHTLVPLTPPRLVAATGMVDTAHILGPSVYGDPSSDTLANQYAAMPSLHVGWAAAVAVFLLAATRSRWRWLWLLHPTVTIAVVVVTANHYWLDAIVAVALLVASTMITGRPRTTLPGNARDVSGQRRDRLSRR